jgi:uncharacterized membrane protein YkoI
MLPWGTMNTYRHIIAGMALLTASPLLAQEEILPTELPPAARSTLDRATGGQPIKKITREIEENGRKVFVIEVDQDNAINPRFRIAESGELVAAPMTAPLANTSMAALDPTMPAPVTYDFASTLESAPQAVQDTIRREARGRPVADVDQESWDGRTVYEVEFRAAGRNPQLHVAEDGTILRQDDAGRRSSGIKDLFLGTQLSDTPSAVQATIQREAAGRPINDIDVERRTGNIVYEVEISDPNARVFQLHVDQDGRIIKDSRVNAPEAK